MDILLKPSTLHGVAVAPASKSHAHRALICAALCPEPTQIELSSLCEDTEATIRCLRALGAEINISGKTVLVVPHPCLDSGVLDCGESGSTLRFMLPVAASLGCTATFCGRGRLGERPISELVECMKPHGVHFDSERLPLTLSGKMSGGDFFVGGDKSSQFLTGLLLALPVCRGRISLTSPLSSKPYVALTLKIMRDFGVDIEHDNGTYRVKDASRYISPKKYQIEGDWSNGAFWLASGVAVSGLDENSTQGDKAFSELLIHLGAKKTGGGFELSSVGGGEINVCDIPDLVMPLVTVCATACGTSRIYGGERLKLKESDRLKSVYDMLCGVGADVHLTDDGFIIKGKDRLVGGEVFSQNDHRIAMATAILALRSEGDIILHGAESVNKSYPTFWDEYRRLGGIYEVL